MGYFDRSMIPIRHLGKLKFLHTFFGGYQATREVLTGTFLTTPTEQEAIDGTQTIIITLGQGKWVASGTKFNAVRQAIINGLDSAQSESTGWNTKIRDAMAVTTVVRTSDTVVTITLPATPTYKITADETVTFTLPRNAVEGYPATLPNQTIAITNATPVVTAALTGTLLTTPTESEIITGGQTVIITLTGGNWITGAAFDAQRQAIINGMVSDGAEAAGWDVEVIGALAVTDVVRTAATIVTITLPAVANYAITADETVTVTIPKEAIQLADTDVAASNTIDVTKAPTITAALTGTFLTTPTEEEVIAGTQTVIITLTSGTWVASGATFNAQRQGIINGMTSAGVEATGWNTKVRDVMDVSTVVRTNDTTVTITLPATADYNISANETVTVTIPRTAIVEADSAVVATETIPIVKTGAITAALTGTFLTTPTETEVIAGTQTVIITLTGSTWIGAAGFDAQRQGIIDGMTAAEVEASGWNTKVRDVMAVTTVVRTNDTTVTVTLPATADYNISANENLTVTIPAAAVIGADAAVVATETPVIANDTPAVTAALTGTLLTTPTQAEIVAGGQTIIITLTGGNWATGAAFDAQRQAIINGLNSDGVEATGWDAVVVATLTVTDVVRTADTIVTITLPACATYAIDADESVTVTVPRLAVQTLDAAINGDVTIDIPAVTAALTGTFLTTPTEPEVVTGGQTIIITLSNGTLVAAGAVFNAQRQSIIDGMTAAESEANGWNSLVKPSIPQVNVVRTSSTVVTITLPAIGGYVITADENVTVTVPKAAIVDGVAAAVVATPVIVIANS